MANRVRRGLWRLVVVRWGMEGTTDVRVGVWLVPAGWGDSAIANRVAARVGCRVQDTDLVWSYQLAGGEYVDSAVVGLGGAGLDTVTVEL